MNAADQAQPLPWAKVSQHPDFQKADWQTRQKMRNNYVDQVVRPLAKSEEDFQSVRDRFFTATEVDVFGERTRRQRTRIEDSETLNAGYGGGLAEQRALDERDIPVVEPANQNLDSPEPGDQEGRTAAGWGLNLSRGAAEGAIGSIGAATEGAGLIGEQAGVVEANRKVDDAIKRLETTQQQYEAALEGTTDAYREDVEGNYQRLINGREKELHQAMTDWAEREPSKVAQWLRDRGVDLRETAQSVGPDEEYRGVATDLAGGLGSMLTYMGPGLVAGALTRGSSAAAMATAVGMAGPSGVSDQYQRAIAGGLDEEAALEKAMQGFAGGAIQVAPLAAMVRPLPAELQGKAIGQLYGILRAAGSEAVVEGSGAVLQNLIEQSYNPERGTWDDTAYKAAISGGSAGLLQAGIQVATRGRGMSAGPRQWEQAAPERQDEQKAPSENTDGNAEWEAAWREQAAEDGISDFDPSANIPDTTIDVEGQAADSTTDAPPQTEAPQADAEQHGASTPAPAQAAPQEDDTGARLIRSPAEQLDPMEQRARERLLTGDGYAYLRERAEGNDAAVSAVDRMQVLANEGDADGAADAYKEARHLLAPANQAQPIQQPQAVEQQTVAEADVMESNPSEATANNGAGVDMAADIERAAMETNPEPTPAQAEAGNYRKGRIQLNGFDIAIENPKGSTRRGTAPDGTEWESDMAHHYGDIKGTKAADGDNLDVFVGDNPSSERAFIIDQVNADGTYDEAKIMLGFDSLEQARQGYLANYDEGWSGLGNISEMSMDDLKTWTREGATDKPYGETKTPTAPSENAAAPSTASEIAPGAQVVHNGRTQTVADVVMHPTAGRRLVSFQDAPNNYVFEDDVSADASPAENQQVSEPVEKILPEPDVQPTPTLKADGKPFQTRRAVELSKRFRDTPNATPVEVEGGWGFAESANIEPVSPTPQAESEPAPTPGLSMDNAPDTSAAIPEPQQPAPQTEQAAPAQSKPRKPRKPAALTPRQQRVSEAFGGAVTGDTINLLSDVGYSKAGNAYVIDSINKDGTLQATNVERGSSVLISQGDWTLATRRTKAPVAEVVSKADPDDARYSVATESAVASQTPRAADITAALKGQPELAGTRVIQSSAELPPNALLGMMFRGINPADVRGMFVDDDLYVVAGNLTSVEEGVQTAIHEAVGHKGIRGVLGEELTPVMRQVYETLPRDPRGREALNEVLESYPFLDQSNTEHQITIAEEMVAHLAEKGWQPNVLRRAVARIRELLRRYFPGINWTDTDVMQLSERSREYLRRQQQASEGVEDSEIGFSLNNRNGSATSSSVQSGLSEVSGIGRPKVLESADNLAMDIALESTIAGVNPQDAIAFYHGDDLYVIAGNASDAAEAVRATVSTVVGNKGLRATMGERIDLTLTNVVSAAQKSIVGRESLRVIQSEYDHLSIKHAADQVNLGAELVARMSELADPPAFIQEASAKLDELLQSGYPGAGFKAGDGQAMARQNRHHLQQQQRDFGEGKPPYSLPYVFSAQDGPGRGTLLDMNTQVVDANGDIVSDARIDGAFKSAAKYGQAFFESATDRLRRSNSPVLKELAKRVDAYFDQAEARLGMVNGTLREPLNRLRTLNPFERRRNMRDFESYMRHRDNGRTAEAQSVAEQNPAVAELVEAVDTMFDQVGTINQTVKTPQGTGMRVFDSKTGAYRKIGKFKRGGFWPRAVRPEVQRVMHDPTSNTKLWHELLDALIDDGRASNRKEAAEYLRGNSGYFTTEVTSDYFAGIEKARGEKLPEMFYDYRFDVVSNYARKWSDRISQVEQFGQKIGPMGKDAFEEAATVARDQRTKDYIGWLADRAYNRRPTDAYHELMANANLAATGLQLGNPGTATLNIIGGTQLNVQMFGSKRMAKAYLDLAIDAKNIYREGVELGILGKDVLNILRDADNRNADYMDANSKTKEMLGKFSAFTMKWGGYTGTEQVIRATGMIAARAQLMDALHAWNKRPHSRDARTYRKFMERNRIDVAKLLRENGKGEETGRYLRLMVNIPQGSYRVDQTPIYVDTPMGRFFFKYQKFGTQVSRLFWQQKLKPMMDAWADPNVSVTDKALSVLPVLQWIGWAVAGGGAVLAARSAMFGYIDPGPELEEIKKAIEDDGFIPSLGLIAAKAHANMVAGSAYGFFGSYIQMVRDVADQQRVKNPLSPPGLAPIDAGVELLQRWMEQDGRLYAADLNQVVERQISLYRTSKRGLAALGNQAGFEADFIQLEQARRDLQYIRKAARRFASENGIEATRTSSGRFGLTENTAANREIANAILVGDGRRAAALVDAALNATQTKEEEIRRKQSIRSTVRARHPVQLGGPASEEEVYLFLEWADDRLPASRALFVRELVERYEDAAYNAGL